MSRLAATACQDVVGEPPCASTKAEIAWPTGWGQANEEAVGPLDKADSGGWDVRGSGAASS